MRKQVFISGATSGIGKATAVRLANAGYDLILNGRRKERLQELREMFKDQVEVHLAPFDISALDEVESWQKENQSLIKKVDILINNAGLARGKDPVQTAKLSDWNQMIDTNLKGLLYLTKVFIPSLIEHKGHLVNLGSVAGRWTYPGGSVYNATKFAVRALSEAFRMDLSGTGVRVTNIEPGMVETEFSQVRFDGDQREAKKVYEGMKPLSADDIAEAISWALHRPAHVNIQELVIFPTDQASVRDVSRK